MYNQFFGLAKSPFSLTPDPDFLYLTGRHREALAALTYALLARKGFFILTGDAGTGKTTILARVLRHLRATRVQCSVVVNPTLTPPEFLEAALLGFGITHIPRSKAQRIFQLENLLKTLQSSDKISALIIDEAHTLSLDLLEEIRLLGNFECAEHKLLQIVLIGQSELDEVLNTDKMRQFKQRIALRVSLAALTGKDIHEYINYRWRTAGGAEQPFTRDALISIGDISRGVPRVINVLCDNALMHAFGEGSVSVETHHVRAASEDLRFAAPRMYTMPAPQHAPVLEIAAPAPQIDASPLMTLERYSAVTVRRSFLARLGGKLGFHQRIETA